MDRILVMQPLDEVFALFAVSEKHHILLFTLQQAWHLVCRYMDVQHVFAGKGLAHNGVIGAAKHHIT